MASFARVIREAILFQPSSPARWRDLEFYARAAVLLVILAILAGIRLRLSGWGGGAYSWFFLSSAGDDSWLPMASPMTG